MTFVTMAILSGLVGMVAGLLVGQAKVVRERANALRYANELRRRIANLEGQQMAGEARSRGVGGTGEHAPPIITPLDDRSRAVAFSRDARWTIPTDRDR